MILNDIEAKLKEIDEHVFYGLADEDELNKNRVGWNYIVFRRKDTSVGAQKRDFSDRYIVGVVRENYIPEGLEIEVMDKMCEIAGMKIGSADCVYSYSQKPNTNTVVEILTMEFVKARKRVVM